MAVSQHENVSAVGLEVLERDFDDVIRQLGGEENLERFRVEYERLHNALKKSHAGERAMIKKAQELSQEMAANAAKMEVALRLSQEDHNTIESLKAEIEKAFAMVDAAHEKESRAKETIQQLKKEAGTLAQLVEKGASLTRGQEVSLAELTEAKKELARERDALTMKAAQQLREMKEALEKKTKIEAALKAKENDVRHISSRIAEVTQNLEKETRARERGDAQAKELLQLKQARDAEFTARSDQLREKTELVRRYEQEIGRARKQTEDLFRATTAYQNELDEKKRGLQDEQETSAKQLADIRRLEEEIKRREDGIAQSRLDQARALKARDAKFKQLRQVTQECDDARHEQEMLRGHASNLKRALQRLEEEEAEHKTALKGIEHDAQGVKSRSESEVDKQARLRSDINAIVEHRAILEREVASYVRSNHALKQDVLRLETEREKLAEASSAAAVQARTASEEGKVLGMQCGDLEKQIADATRRLQEQQAQYEQVRSDRNLYSKNLIEAQDEISEMKQKFKIMGHQIDQLKEELAMKEKKNFEAVTNQKALSEKLAKVKKETNYLSDQLNQATTRSEAFSQEIKQLSKVIGQCDADLSVHQQRFVNVTNERDVLGTQLIRRNDELALLYEKIRIQQVTLSRGEVQFRDRVTDMRMLRLKVSELKRHLHMAQVRVQNAAELNVHARGLARQLALERTKVQALSEELENPQNAVRWRRLAGEDPNPEEKIRRIAALQRRLILVMEQCVEKDAQLQEKEKLFIELRAILARQPGPEVAEQLSMLQQDLRRRNTRLKGMASELNMAASQQAEFRYDAERLNRELQDTKRRYFETKMAQQGMLAERRALASTTGHGAAASNRHTKRGGANGGLVSLSPAAASATPDGAVSQGARRGANEQQQQAVRYDYAGFKPAAVAAEPPASSAPDPAPSAAAPTAAAAAAATSPVATPEPEAPAAAAVEEPEPAVSTTEADPPQPELAPPSPAEAEPPATEAVAAEAEGVEGVEAASE